MTDVNDNHPQFVGSSDSTLTNMSYVTAVSEVCIASYCCIDIYCEYLAIYLSDMIDCYSRTVMYSYVVVFTGNRVL